MRMRLTILLAAVTVLIVATDSARACSCIQFSPCEAFGHSSAVFVGRMLGGTEKYREYKDGDKIVSLETGQLRFAVEEPFKGVTGAEVTVFADNMRGTSCEGMAALARGEKYLVYASHSNSLGLAIGPCSATKKLVGASADLEFLRNLPPLGSGGRLYGQVAVETGSREPAPLPDVPIVVEDESHNRREVKTDKDGNFEVTGLKPGIYIVSPMLPKNYVFRDSYQRERKVTISDRACTRAQFWVNIN